MLPAQGGAGAPGGGWVGAGSRVASRVRTGGSGAGAGQPRGWSHTLSVATSS